MRPLHDSISFTELLGLNAGDKVIFRLVNDEQISGTLDTVSPQYDEFTFVGRGVHIHGIEIARIEKHIPGNHST
ncbi:hypothetical protein B5M42_020990 [Paenibacillus athensensis]|uniref:DUF2642 domain-containing protein n=1 Tax=Paenibacillus athensensis TaxID=1967502 RepID=A0A4Y8PYT4_9BACL|nr:hypothetical protein [Paenibacillus athensensis]MCD1261281.1 hypothetical protein [Paenibacillus athensensis]